VKLVDTSVWVDFFRGRVRAGRLAKHLEANEVLLHPWVLGELALGHLGTKRAEILGDLRLLPVAPVLPDAEVLAMIDGRRLAGRGIGWVDAQLLASAESAGARLWTWDTRLARLAMAVHLSSG
jgi:predicted nucleic acid-binding protein